MLQLLDPPLGVLDRVRLLADDLVAEGQVVGKWRGVLTHAKIVRPRMLSKRPLIADFRRLLGYSAAAAGRCPGRPRRGASPGPPPSPPRPWPPVSRARLESGTSPSPAACTTSHT